jgi:hypothetical protein
VKPGPKPRSVALRFWENVLKVEGEGACWPWQGSLNAGGYGRLKVGGKYQLAHRISYEYETGPIPEALTIDHLCRNRSCVRPCHLEVVTSAENVLRGEGPTAQNSKKDRCVNGHPLCGDNLYVHTYRGVTSRHCCTCRKNAVEKLRLKNESASDKGKREYHKSLPRLLRLKEEELAKFKLAISREAEQATSLVQLQKILLSMCQEKAA